MYCNFCMQKIEESDKECPFCGNSVDYEAPAHHLMPGTVLRGRYLVGAALGEGGFGITYIGMDTTLKMRIAVKEYYPSGFVNRNNTVAASINESTTKDRKEFVNQGKEKFLTEAQILASFCGKPGIVEVRDFFEENNTAYIVMEYLDGQTLREYMKEIGKLAPKRVYEFLLPVMESLKQIHKQGIIHRDISPDNIMLIDDNVKLLDFGSARAFSSDNKSLSVMVKPGYAPPEQYGRKGKQGPWTDIYALCATIYKCITGITPDDASDRLFTDQLKSPSALGIEIDEAFECALMKGLAVQYIDRFQSIDELLNGFNAKIVSTAEDDSKTIYIPKKQPSEMVFILKDEPQNNLQTEDNRKTELLLPSQSNDENRAVILFKQDDMPTTYLTESANNDTFGLDKTENDTTPVPNTENKTDKRKKHTKIIALVTSAGVFCAVLITTIILMSKAVNSSSPEGNVAPEYILSSTTTTSSSSKSVSSSTSNKSLSSSQMSEVPIEPVETTVTILGVKYNIATTTELNLWDAKITDEQLKVMVPEIKKLINLSSLELGNNQISDITPLANLTKLTELHLDLNPISDITPLNALTNLTTLELWNNQISDISPLAKLTNLTWLSVSTNPVSDITPLAELTKLTWLSLGDNQISDITPLANLTNLKELHLDKNQISDISLIANFTNLTVLWLDNNQISDITPIANLTNLTYLDLLDNPIIENDISALKAKLTNCDISY